MSTEIGFKVLWDFREENEASHTIAVMDLGEGDEQGETYLLASSISAIMV